MLFIKDYSRAFYRTTYFPVLIGLHLNVFHTCMFFTLNFTRLMRLNSGLYIKVTLSDKESL